MTQRIEYVARLPHVRDVTLLGTADLGFWAERLRGEGLTPLDDAGKAQILVIAADAHFMGLSFQEVSFSVLVAPTEVHEAGSFLLQAFNSRRFFAFCERTFFRTPYAFAGIRVSAAEAAFVELTRGRDILFRATMRDGAAPGESQSSSLEKGFAGPVHLPGRRLFYAEIRGEARSSVFQPSRDAFELRPGGDLPMLKALADSRFEPVRWLVRPDAKHAKSKTYRA